MKVEYKGRLDKRFDIWSLETEKPLETVKALGEVAEKTLQNSRAFSLSRFEDALNVFFEYDKRLYEVLAFQAWPNQGVVSVTVDVKSAVAEDLAKQIVKQAFPEIEWPNLSEDDKQQFLLEQERLKHLEKVKESLTAFDYKVLELRSQGASLWGIASKLGVSIGKVRWSLQKLALLPETSEKLGAYKPLSRSERFKKH